jgi:DnaK suppressor protein
MAIDTTTLQELREKLESEKKQLEKDLARFADPTETDGEYETRFDNIGEDRDENATEVERYVDDLALEDELERRLREVVEALGRLDSETYGICEKGGEDIDIDRLRAYPAARTCVRHG